MRWPEGLGWVPFMPLSLPRPSHSPTKERHFPSPRPTPVPMEDMHHYQGPYLLLIFQRMPSFVHRGIFKTIHEQQRAPVKMFHSILKWKKEHENIDCATRDICKATWFLLGPPITQGVCPKLYFKTIEAQGELETHSFLPTKAQQWGLNTQEIQRQNFVTR